MDERIHIPEVIEPDEKLPQDLVALRRFANVMDALLEVPGTRMRVGVDALLGLIPGFGDVAGAVLSTWIIAGALRHRVPTPIIFRMIANIAVDLILGAIPVAGDLFDFLFEENMRNMRLLERHRDRRRPPRTFGQIAAAIMLVVIFVFGLAVVSIAALVALLLWITGQRNTF